MPVESLQVMHAVNVPVEFASMLSGYMSVKLHVGFALVVPQTNAAAKISISTIAHTRIILLEITFTIV